MSAARARQRIGSEPGLWEGSEAVRQDFIRELGDYGLSAVRGGRFLHIMPSVDKVTAMEVLISRYRACWPGSGFMVVAAGDSPNDAAMLRAADRAVVIRSSDGAWMPWAARGVMRSPEPGPTGWNHVHQPPSGRIHRRRRQRAGNE
ncbi:MAG: HAD hydrolase family protein [Gammaproteobacteria bacterium]|nr:HAD hydrolase family protein [Gammaproteobacteria bacterium]